MRRILAGLLALAIPSFAVAQQSNYQPAPMFSGSNLNRSTLNSSVGIAASGVFQQLLPSTMLSNTTQRQSLTIENNNTTSPTVNCWIYFGLAANAATTNSILLQEGGSYTRYWPIVPSDAIQGTCNGSTTSQYIYVDTQ